MASIEKGASFCSFNDFSIALKQYEEVNGVLFIKSSSKKLKQYSPNFDNLKYESIRYACKQGHRTRPSVSRGLRQNQRTFKTDCPAFIWLHTVEDGETGKLRISTCNLVHENHPTGRQFSQHFPENRKPAVTHELKTILNIKSVATQDIKEIVRKNDGKVISGQDVRNLKKKLFNHGSEEEAHQVERLLESLQADGGKFKYGVNELNDFKYLAIMTKEMLNSLALFPEVLIMDTTYKINKNNYPLLNILAVDSNGQGRPVFHAFLASEGTDILSSCLSFFAGSFSSHLIKTIFVDKDMAEICAIRSSLPSVSIRLCAFHTTTAIKKALQQRKLLSCQALCLLDLFAEQKSSSDLSHYNALKEKISELSPPDVLAYFASNWWNCPQLWAASFLDTPTFHITTTNHAETFHQKIKRIPSSKTPLNTCITELLRITQNTMQSRDASDCIHSMSLKYNTKHNSDIVNTIQNDLTPFGARIVIEQFLLFQKANYLFQCSLSCSDTYILSSTAPGSSQYDCTIHSCSCDFFSNFHLPCRHFLYALTFLCRHINVIINALKARLILLLLFFIPILKMHLMKFSLLAKLALLNCAFIELKKSQRQLNPFYLCWENALLKMHYLNLIKSFS